MSDEISHEMQLEWAELEKELDWTWMQDVDWSAYEAEPGTGMPATALEARCAPPKSIMPGGWGGVTAQDQQGVFHIQHHDFPNTSEDAVAATGAHGGHDASHSSVSSTSDGNQQHRRRYDDNTGGASTTHRCTIDQCNYKGTFARVAELQRHIATKHNGTRSFICTVSDCFKDSRAPSFVRGDKLTAHIRAVHSPTEPATCPVAICSIKLPLVLLGVHILLGHQPKSFVAFPWDKQQDPSLRAKATAIVCASDTTYTRCPYLRCRQKLNIDRLARHVLSHKLEEQREMEHSLQQLNYALVRVPKVDSAIGAAGHQSMPAKSFDHHSKLRISCPVCEHTCDDRFMFAVHLTRDHMIQNSTGARAEFDAATRDQEFAQVRNAFSLSWYKASFRDWLFGCTGHPQCHSCNYPFFRECRCETKPPLRSYDDIVESLRPHRIQILLLLPPFRHLTPIFEDII